MGGVEICMAYTVFISGKREPVGLKSAWKYGKNLVTLWIVLIFLHLFFQCTSVFCWLPWNIHMHCRHYQQLIANSKIHFHYKLPARTKAKMFFTFIVFEWVRTSVRFDCCLYPLRIGFSVVPALETWQEVKGNLHIERENHSCHQNRFPRWEVSPHLLLQFWFPPTFSPFIWLLGVSLTSYFSDRCHQGQQRS